VRPPWGGTQRATAGRETVAALHFAARVAVRDTDRVRPDLDRSSVTAAVCDQPALGLVADAVQNTGQRRMAAHVADI